MNTTENFKMPTIFGIDIPTSYENNAYVPIRHICGLFGIASNDQIEKIKNDPLYSSMVILSASIGKDGKRRKMSCLHIDYIFAWILGINSLNVRMEVRKKLLGYQKSCIVALKAHLYSNYLVINN